MSALRPDLDEALAEWARKVRTERAQVESVRQVGDGPDFYAPIAQAFKADPRRTDEPALDVLRGMVEPGDTWLDIGAGGGRYGLPIALLANEVVAVEPSAGMAAMLAEGMAEHDIGNVRVVAERWPGADVPVCDVALIAHVGYDIEEIGPFLDAMEGHAKRLCVAVLLERQPARLFDPFWRELYGIEREPLPALPDFMALLLGRGKLFEMRVAGRRPPAYTSFEGLLAMARRQTWVEEGSEKDRRLVELLRERATERDGSFSLETGDARIGVVSWEP